MQPIQFGGIIAQVPIVQGGMGVGISLSSLASAVAAEGGVGVISAAAPGYSWDGFENNPAKANLEALTHHIKTAKKNAKGGIIGVNIMCALNNYVDYVKCCVENNADIIISGAGLPTDLPETLARFGGTTKIAPIVSSKKAVAILLKLWDRKFKRTADMVVIEGPKAGGHLGFSLAELEKDEKELDYNNEIQLILHEIAVYEEKYNRKIPAVFAGGVHTRDDINRYLALGCAGVQIATRFVATEECDASEAFKNAYVQAKKEDIIIVKSPVGMPGRALNNDFIQKIVNHRETAKCIGCITYCNPKTRPYCIIRALINAVKGNIDNALIFCGANVDKITEISTIKKVIKELTKVSKQND